MTSRNVETMTTNTRSETMTTYQMRTKDGDLWAYEDGYAAHDKRLPDEERYAAIREATLTLARLRREVEYAEGALDALMPPGLPPRD